MNNQEIRDRLNHYHSGPKVKVGSHYEAAAPAPVKPKPAPPNQAVLGMEQAAKALFELSRLYRNSGA
ncbi:MAG: hypothetical protein Q8L15_07575 [Methylobacter sp.]|nr:hypothetical protein [Methylobacter sp.]